MNTVDVERLRQIRTLPSLVKFLRDELEWPVEADEIDELTFDYAPEELGLNAKYAKMIKEIKQIRPLDSKQPWGIFWVNFEKKRLPMVVLRRILGSLVIKRRASARKTDRPSWHLNDLMFISSYGEEEHRTISFAHFAEEPDTDQLPVLRVLGWDDRKSIMNLDRVGNRLHSHLRWPADSKAADAWRKCWSEAFTDRYREAIRSADELIPRLAELAAGVRVRVRDVLHAEIERGPMRRLFAAVQKFLIHDMNEDGFADMYAQTVAYGLLSARFSRSEGLTAQNLVQLTAVSNPFLENLLENLFRLNRGKFHFDVDEVGINDVLDLLRNTNIEAIKAAFSDKNPAEDPVIHFYEGFLKQYDPQQRVQRGVFFTPRPVVSYIVRSVDELLRTEFGLEDGLASTATWAEMKQRFPGLTIPKGVKPDDPFVCILDPAVGTGTFLFECIEIIERTMKDKWCSELGKKAWNDHEIIKRWREYVRNHLLPRLYGYELMMAPYAIAHLKLALKLGETGYQFQEKDRLHIYLTNSLEPPSELADLQLADLFTALATEAQEVNEVKRGKLFTVVIGNPPYSNYSANLSPQCRKIVDKYRSYHRTPIRERNQLQFERNIQDDFVKFVAISEDMLFSSKQGILGMITNATMLGSRSLRGMREHLWNTFDDIYELHLHGGTNEIFEGSQQDQNVFDIEQAVAIHIYQRKSGRGCSTVRLDDLVGTRIKKYEILSKGTILARSCHEIIPDDDNCGFVVQDEHSAESLIPINEIFVQYGAGIKTNRDAVVIAFERSQLLRAVETFDSSLVESTESKDCIKTILYRPFDLRFIYYHKKAVKSRSYPTMRHMLSGPNIGLMACSTWTTPERFSVNVSKGLVEMKTGTHDRGTTFFPLYVYNKLLEKQLAPKMNISPRFISKWKAATKTHVLERPEGNSRNCSSPEEIFYWIYACCHSQTYRDRYKANLSRGFPGIPLTGNRALLKTLCNLGCELISLHLMESDKLANHVTTYPVSGDNRVAKVGEKGKTLADVKDCQGRLYINEIQYFDSVPEDVWNFHIGGYQVCHKWLVDRKKTGRKLSAEDIDHYHKIVVAINETIKIMNQIDEVIEAHGGWPIK